MNALPEKRDVDLDTAIDQLINLGEKDPITVTRRLLELYGGDWIAEQLAGSWEEIISEKARHRLGNQRRSSIHAISMGAGDKVKKRDAVLASLYIPSKGYIVLGDATREDLAEAEGYRRRLAAGLSLWADWYRDTRELLEQQNVTKVRQLRGELPPLPPKRELEAGA